MAPTILLIPGAWHVANSVSLLLPLLKSAGFKVEVAQLPTVGTTKSLAEDIDHVKAVLQKLLDNGEEVVPVLHSYAGFPGSVAVKGMGKKEINKDNKPGVGSVLGLIYISAFIPHENVSLEEMVGGTLPAWQDINVSCHLCTIPRHTLLTCTSKESTSLIDVHDPATIFYGDVPEDLKKQALAELQLQSLHSFRDKVPPTGFTDAAYEGRRVYILTTDDPCFPVPWQEGGLAGSGVEWTKVSMATSHSPFLSQPEALTEQLTKFANSWA